MPFLDTSVVVDLIRGHRNPRFRAALKAARELVFAREHLYVSRLTQAELYAGVYQSSRPEHELNRVTAVLAPMRLIELTHAIAQEFGKTTAQLHKAGTSMGDIDALIAAACLVHDEPILTANPKHFRKVKGLTVLTYL
jgi:predicted nucleic acid-binding protein